MGDIIKGKGKQTGLWRIYTYAHSLLLQTGIFWNSECMHWESGSKFSAFPHLGLKSMPLAKSHQGKKPPLKNASKIRMARLGETEGSLCSLFDLMLRGSP